MERKELFCRTFLASHEAWEPETLPWPDLDDRSLAILRSIPVWNMALQVEVNAGAMIAGFAETQSDPLVKEALLLQAREEERHGRMIAVMAQRYALRAAAGPPKADPTRRAFIDFGYNECLDSFFGFGVFRIARQAQFLPESLTVLFDRVLREEARHIVFFVNWVAWDRAMRGLGLPILQVAPAALGYARALSKTAGRAGASRAEDKGLHVVGDFFASLTPAMFLEACLVENASRMSAFDERLARPQLIPTLARWALGIMGGVRRRRLLGPVQRTARTGGVAAD
jgi:hypothetical protein